MPAYIDTTFHKRMLALKAAAAANYRSLIGEQQRQWVVPTEQITDPLNIEKLHTPAYDRTALNTQYDDLTKDAQAAGSCGDILAVRLQLAAMAVEERAYRHRHMSLARAVCVAHGRLYGMGEGELFGPQGIEGDVAAYIKAGAKQG